MRLGHAERHYCRSVAQGTGLPGLAKLTTSTDKAKEHGLRPSEPTVICPRLLGAEGVGRDTTWAPSTASRQLGAPQPDSLAPCLLTGPQHAVAVVHGQARSAGLPLCGVGSSNTPGLVPHTLGPGKSAVPAGPPSPRTPPGRPAPTPNAHTYWSWLGQHRDWLGHWNGTGPGDGQVELLGLCDLGLRLRGEGLTGQHLLQLVDQLLDLRLPPGRGRWEKLQRLLLKQAERGVALGT